MKKRNGWTWGISCTRVSDGGRRRYSVVPSRAPAHTRAVQPLRPGVPLFISEETDAADAMVLHHRVENIMSELPRVASILVLRERRRRRRRRWLGGPAARRHGTPPTTLLSSMSSFWRSFS